MKWPILAASSADEEWWKQIAPSRNEFGLLFIAIGVIATVVLIWAVFIRKRESDRPSRYSYPQLSPSKNGVSGEGGSGRQRRRKRKRRRNPTLAETGGLPPVRSEGMPDDPP
jgi:hypothetical protein